MTVRGCSLKSAVALTAGTLSLLLTGCGIQNAATNGGSLVSAAVPAMGGSIHGGSQPISGATVTLWMAGSNGYGAATGTGAAAPIAHATTDGLGNFGFVFDPSGTSGNTNANNTYNCSQASSVNNLVYLVATGGSTSGSGASSNAASEMLLGLGSCTGTTSLPTLTLNEATTVASVYALQQFMQPAPGGNVYIGAKDATPFSTQALTNAMLTITNITDISAGSFYTSHAIPTPTGAPAGVTMTVTPETAKLNTIANILAGCVNSTGGAPCTALFAAAKRPSNAGQTSQPSATFPTASDTVMAAYYMAINPVQGQAATAGETQTTLFNLLPGNLPFAPALSAAPTDWTVGAAYQPTGTCTALPNQLGPLAAPRNLAIDAKGNIWVVNANAASPAPKFGTVSEFAPSGLLSQCLDGTISFGTSITIDKNNNVWVNDEGSTTAQTSPRLVEFVNGGSTSTYWPTGSNLEPYGVGVDDFGNVFASTFGTAGTSESNPILEWVGAASANATVQPPNGVLPGIPTFDGFRFAVTGDGNFYLPSQDSKNTTNLFQVLRGTAPNVDNNQPQFYSGTEIGVGSNATVFPSGAIDNSGIFVGANEAQATSPGAKWFNVIGTGFTLSAQYAGGLNYGYAVAVDGANNYWTANNTAVTGTSAAKNQVYGLAEVDAAFNSLAPTGATPSTATGAAGCTFSVCTSGGSFQRLNGLATGFYYGLGIDGSGNLWATSSNGYLVETIGAAVPVITPVVSNVVANYKATHPNTNIP